MVNLRAANLDYPAGVKVILKRRLWNKEKPGPPLELPCFRNNNAGRFRAESMAVSDMLALGCSHRFPAGVLSWPFMCAVYFGLETGSIACCPHVCGMYSCGASALWLPSISLVITCPISIPPPTPACLQIQSMPRLICSPKDDGGGTMVESSFSG